MDAELVFPNSMIEYGYFSGTIMLNAGYDKESAEKVLNSGTADLVSFGVPFIANPDLPHRFEQNAPLSEAVKDTFYGGDEKGYTDYSGL